MIDDYISGVYDNATVGKMVAKAKVGRGKRVTLMVVAIVVLAVVIGVVVAGFHGRQVSKNAKAMTIPTTAGWRP